MSDSDSTPDAPPSLVPPPETLSSPVTVLPESTPPLGAGAASKPSRSLPPMPSIAPALEDARQARLATRWDDALEAYKKALFLVSPTDTAAQASLYANVAEVKLAQGKPREAETNFEKALAASRKHLRSLDGLVLLATQAEEWERAATHRQRLAAAQDDDDERLAELVRAADVYERKAGEPARAAEVLEMATLVRPDELGVHLKLRQLYEGLRAWPKLIRTLDTLVRLSQKPRDRGTFRFAQADVVLGRLRDEPRGLAFVELALDEDPQNDRALSALIAVRTRREEWAELAAIYENLVDRFAGLGDRVRAWEVCKKLGVLRRDRLADGLGALEAFQGAVEVRPDDAESRAALAELHAAKGDRAMAVQELELVARHAPTRSQTYRRLFDLHTRAQRADRAWLVATCLEALSAADVSHELVIEQFRPDGAIRPTVALDEASWDPYLRAPGHDAILSDLLRIIGETAITLRVEYFAAKGKLAPLDVHSKQDKAGTASVVRTFVWAARALCIALPDLYLLNEVPHGLAAVPGPAPSIAIGPSMRTGMTVQQLAFLAGRHLTYYRQEHYVLVFFPTLAELSALVLAAVQVVIPGISLPPAAEGDVSAHLGGRLNAGQKTRLGEVVARLDARGGKLDLLAWIRHVELTAARAGLLLSGDLRVAMRSVDEEVRSIGELSAEAKRGDLLAFTASNAYATLRERMGVAILSPG